MLHLIIYGLTSTPLLVYVLAVWAVMLPRAFFAYVYYALYHNARNPLRYRKSAWLFTTFCHRDAAKSVALQTTRYYAPVHGAAYGVSVIVTVTAYADAEAFERALVLMRESLEAADVPHEILVVIDAVPQKRMLYFGTTDAARAMRRIREIAQRYANYVAAHNNGNKRVGLVHALRRARHPIAAMMDDDTICERTTVPAALAYFANPRIGGVTTAQRVYKPETVMQRIADWLENARLMASMPAMALFGQVGCLPGRLYFVRRALLLSHLEAFTHDYAWYPRRVLRKPGDDRWITMCIMRQGYWTVLAPAARVQTLAPATVRETIPQQRRWAVSSQWYTLESLSWLWRFPMTAFVYLSDIIVITLGTVAMTLYWAYVSLTGDMDQSLSAALAIALAGMSLTVAIRQLPHLSRNWRDIPLIPLFALWAFFMQIDARLRGLVWPVWGRWQTRAGVDGTDAGRKEFWVIKDERIGARPGD